jgi:hypothetical protein
MIPVGLVYAKHSWRSPPASPQPARRPGPVLSTPRSLQKIKREITSSSKSVLRIRDVYPGSRIPDPDFYPSRIPDPGSRIPDPKTATKERGEKKLVVIPFYVAENFKKL